MSKKLTEYRFEEWVEKSLHTHGYTSRLYSEYDKDLCLIVEDVVGFIKDTQEEEYAKLYAQFDESTDSNLCKTINNAIASRGIVEVLRKGISTRGCTFDLVYSEPRSGLNKDHQDLYIKNRFVAVRQLHYSKKNNNSIDMVLFLNGIPIVTMELKNQLTGQNLKNSENQYKNDRDPKEPLLNFQRCFVHFCIDNDVASMSSKLNCAKTKFFPYNKGISNPIVEGDYRTEYIWNEVLTPNSLLDIIQNFLVVVEETDRDWNEKQQRVTETKFKVLIFPRYHQLEVIRNLQREIKKEGVGHNYLIQHTTGSGKSYSIGWLSHTLSSLYKTKEDTTRLFDTILVITDRRVLDKQLQKTLKDLQQTDGVVNPVNLTSKQLKEFLEKGKDIIVTTIQKFPVISETISQLKGHRFAVIIDEVHSSSSGEGSKHLKKSLGIEDSEETEQEEERDYQDIIREEIEARGKQPHISFFGFTGTPKNKTLELFGRKTSEGTFKPFHSYTMKQSIFEGFTLDVLKNYSTYKRYFKVMQTGAEDIELPEGKVKRELVNFADSHPELIKQKVSIILEHFVSKTSKKIEGKARAMVVVRSRKHCVLFHEEMKRQMLTMNLSYSCLVAFSGTILHNGIENSEPSLNLANGMEGTDIPSAFKDPRFRILIISSKFQTGFDEPLVHTMYVDKKLGGVQCVQTLSRLNRTKSGKTETFVLDFVNETEDIVNSFQPFFTTTELTGETEPDKLYDIEYKINSFQLFTEYQIEDFCKEFYKKTDTDQVLHSIIDVVVEKYNLIEEDKQEEFKSTIQSFIRLYSYISQISSFTEIRWEKLYIFIRFLNKKLPKKEGERINISDSIDLDSLRIQYIGESKLSLEDRIGELEPMDAEGSKTQTEEEKELLSEIIKVVNEVHGVALQDEDKLDLKNVNKRLIENKDLDEKMSGNNSFDDKKEYFNSLFKGEVSEYYGDRLDFYKKVMNPKVLPMLMDVMFTDYLKQKGM